MDFIPGDRLLSRKSGKIYRYAAEALTIVRPPEVPLTHIPVRDELFSGNIVWLPDTLFTKVDDDYPDAAKTEHES